MITPQVKPVRHGKQGRAPRWKSTPGPGSPGRREHAESPTPSSSSAKPRCRHAKKSDIYIYKTPPPSGVGVWPGPWILKPTTANSVRHPSYFLLVSRMCVALAARPQKARTHAGLFKARCDPSRRLFLHSIKESRGRWHRAVVHQGQNLPPGNAHKF
jgi:hypothetical protein